MRSNDSRMQKGERFWKKPAPAMTDGHPPASIATIWPGMPGRYKQLVRLIARHVGGWNNAFALRQLGKVLRRAFERHAIGCPIEGDYGEHLPGDPEQQVVAPLHTFGRMRKREAVAPDRFDVH